jgi:hypothetical protein
MKNAFKILAMVISIFISGPVLSQSSTHALSTCMVDNLDGKERKNLAKWVFFAMGAHPEIKSYLKVTPGDLRANDKYVGSLITRLLTVDCSDRLKTAYDADPSSVESAFEVVGKVAMQELMTSNEVNEALSTYIQFTDTAKIEKLLK